MKKCSFFYRVKDFIAKKEEDYEWDQYLEESSTSEQYQDSGDIPNGQTSHDRNGTVSRWRSSQLCQEETEVEWEVCEVCVQVDYGGYRISPRE